MGTPTANIDPLPLASRLEGLPNGVYFGWARLEASSAPSAGDEGKRPPEDCEVHKMVMNVGRRPTVGGAKPGDIGDLSVEVHIMHSFSRDFYGEKVKVRG